MKECPACKRCFPDEINHCPKDGDVTTHSLHGEPILDARYQLEERLGQGGMGVVFRARHIFLKTSHAIKVILPDLVGNDPMLVTRFRQEALAAAAIRHPNIIAVTDFGVARGTMPFLVMEFVNGRSLQDILAEEKIMAPDRAMEFIKALASGVAAAHRQNIVHRDLKPLNIMTQTGMPVSEGLKILDFGLAKIKSGDLLGSFVQAKTSGLMGSPFYMAPEQWSDDEPDARADIYSLGIILFQMLTGDVPFKGSSIPSIMKKHLTLPPPTFKSLGLQVPPEIEAVVRHALEKEPDARTPTVDEFLRELNEAVTSSSSSQGRSVVTRSTGALDPNQTIMSPGPTSTLGGLEHTLNEAAIDSLADLGSFAPSGHSVQPQLAEVARLEQEQRERIAREEAERAALAQRQREAEAARRRAEAEEQVRQERAVREERERQQREQMERVERQAKELEERLARLATSMPPATPVIDPEVTQIHGAAVLQTAGNNSFSSSAAVHSQYPPVTTIPPATKTNSYLVAGVVVLLLVVAGLGIGGYFLLKTAPATVQPTTPPVSSQIVSTVQPDFIEIPGGTFLMGRNDGPLQERPAHSVTVNSFLMGPTEVTNAEYVEFVREAGHPAPPHWRNSKPIFGQELWPVVYVSADDAKAFAAWRSKRDNAEYRLPTEQEWEYAARGGDQNNLYPWGPTWVDGKAVVKQDFPKAVGSLPEGKNRWGVSDLIGNVWEWTSTPIELYQGNDEAQFSSQYNGWIVKRGGSFISDPLDKQNPITSTYRDFAPAATKNPTIGFRLVRAAQ